MRGHQQMREQDLRDHENVVTDIGEERPRPGGTDLFFARRHRFILPDAAYIVAGHRRFRHCSLHDRGKSPHGNALPSARLHQGYP